MTEEENVSVKADDNAEAVAEATETDNAQTERQDSHKAAEERKKRNDVEYNWAEARRKMQELERKAGEQAEQLQRLQKPSPPPEEDDIGIADDALAEGKHLKGLMKEIKQLKSYIKEREVSTVDDRLTLKFPDFAEVVTRENIELLKQTEPELADSLRHIPDPYSQGTAAYKLLKKVGVAKTDNSAPEKKKAAENSQKPVSVNAVSRQNSAIGNAHLFENGLTKELKASLYKEMQDAAKRG